MKEILPFEFKNPYSFPVDEIRKSIEDNYENVVGLIKETIYYYNYGNRSVEGTSCKYQSNTGNMCAVGRCLTEDALKDFHEMEKTTLAFAITKLPATIADKYSDFDSMFRERYHGIHKYVWSFLQSLHDEDSNWDGNGLTSCGEAEILDNLGTKIHNDVFGK
jgi:hypothetical protein